MSELLLLCSGQCNTEDMDRSCCIAIALTLLSVFLALSASSDSPVHLFHNRVNDDTGRIISCGPKESELVLDWTPRVLRPGVQLMMDINFNFLKSFSHGTVCATVWLKDVPNPIYHDCSDQRCTDAQKMLKKFMPHLQCPIPEGFGMKFSKMPYMLEPTMPLPSGTFRVAANVTNQDNQLLFCAHGEVEVNDE